MPELPEVETIRKGLEKKVIASKITRVEVRNKKSVKYDLGKFISALEKNSFENIDRIGKLLIFKLKKDDKYLLIHLGMTGRLVYKKNDKSFAGGHVLARNQEFKDFISNLPDSHTHVIFHFANGGDLLFNDARRFGYLKITNEEELMRIKARFGPEPLKAEFSFKKFKEILDRKKSPIKAVLMDQHNMAGIGNIYADESLFEARIDPRRNTMELSPEEKKRLWESIRKILKKAIKFKGTSFSDYVDSEGKKGIFRSFLKVYGRQGQKCYNCPGKVEKIRFAGRGTHFCPVCQK